MDIDIYLEMFEKFSEHFSKVIQESIEFQRGRTDEKILEGMQKAIHVIREEAKWQRFKNADKLVELSKSAEWQSKSEQEAAASSEDD